MGRGRSCFGWRGRGRDEGGAGAEGGATTGAKSARGQDPVLASRTLTREQVKFMSKELGSRYAPTTTRYTLLA